MEEKKLLHKLALFLVLSLFFASPEVQAENASKYVDDLNKIKDVSCQSIEKVLKDPSFHEFTDALQNRHYELLQADLQHIERDQKRCKVSENLLSFGSSCSSPSKNLDKASFTSESQRHPFYIFVSLSMGEKALLNLAEQAKEFGGILVLRGFVEGSYKKTASVLQHIIHKTGQGFMVDPELFDIFQIKAVPTFILTTSLKLSDEKKIPLHDRIQGHVTLSYALQKISIEGDLKKIAGVILKGRNQGK